MAGRLAEDWPDDVLEHIFSFLPTRDVVKTCFLGKRWRYYWTTVPYLNFYVTFRHVRFVDRVVSQYKLQKVKKLHLNVDLEESVAHKIEPLVAFAIDRQVEELLLHMNIWVVCYAYDYRISHARYRLSPLLYNCSSLTSLSSKGCFFPPCEGVGWSSLKSLSIERVDGDVLQKILMGSPVLEYLTLESCWSTEEIRSMSLRELVIDGSFEQYRWQILPPLLRILTPRLLLLRVRVICFHEFIVEAPSLLEATLDFDGPTISSGRYLFLQNATRILLGPWFCRAMRHLKMEDIRRSLPNCKTLTLHMPTSEFRFPAIANMLAATPNLEKLVINFEPYNGPWNVYNMDSANVDYKTYWQLKKKFRRWARHLRNVEIFGFYGCLRVNYEGVLMLIKFLLGHAFVLENMVIKFREGLEYPEAISSKKLHEVIRRLKCYHKASGHAAFVLSYLEEHGKRPRKGIKVTTKSMRI